MESTNRWTLSLCEVTFGKVDTCHCHRALVNAMLIPSHAITVQHMKISESY
jgi:hypothetical protein